MLTEKLSSMAKGVIRACEVDKKDKRGGGQRKEVNADLTLEESLELGISLCRCRGEGVDLFEVGIWN